MLLESHLLARLAFRVGPDAMHRRECGPLCSILLPLEENVVNLGLRVNLANAVNLGYSFVDVANSHGGDSYFFALSQINNSIADCYAGESDFASSKPCTHTLDMVGQSQSQCRWGYLCDYSPTRLPQFLWRADCPTDSQPIIYRIPVLEALGETYSGCVPFRNPNVSYALRFELLSVGCSCRPGFTE